MLTLAALSLQAQNIFLDRAYWKNAPTVATVTSDIKKGNDPAQLNSNAFDATVYAIIESAPDATVQYLMDQPGNDVNKITHDGRTYIFWAAYKGNTQLMEYLQKKGAKTDIVEDHGYTIANFAAATGQANTAVYDLCVTFGANLKKDLDHEGANALLLAAMNAKDFSLIDYFSKKGLDIKSKDSHGNGLPDYAAKQGSTEVMKGLLAKGLKFGPNAMVMAAQGTRSNTNSLATYEFLEKNGAKPNAQDANGNNPLHFVVRKEKQAPEIAYFVSKGVDINQPNKDGNTAFMYAAQSNPDTQILQSFLAQTKKINASNAKGQNALMLATQYNTPEIVNMLLEREADLKASDKDGNNLTYYLTQSFNDKKIQDFEAKAKFLQDKHFDLSQPQPNGNTFCHLAVAKSNPELLKRAISYKIDVNGKNKEGMTALHKAAMTAKDDQLLKLLITLGAKPEIKTDLGETTLELASENEALRDSKISLDFLKA